MVPGLIWQHVWVCWVGFFAPGALQKDNFKLWRGEHTNILPSNYNYSYFCCVLGVRVWWKSCLQSYLFLIFERQVYSKIVRTELKKYIYLKIYAVWVSQEYVWQNKKKIGKKHQSIKISIKYVEYVFKNLSMV